MSTVSAGVSACSFNMTVTQSNVNPITVAPSISVPISFGTVGYVNSVSGSFTPSNNTQTMHTFSVANDQPNWLLLLVDQPIQLTLTLSGSVSPALKMPVQRFAFIGIPTTSVNWNTILIDGTTAAANYLMSQTTGVNYSLFWGNGSLS